MERKFAEMHPNPPPVDPTLLQREDEKQVLICLAKFQKDFERAVELDEPSHLIAVILNLAGTEFTHRLHSLLRAI